MKKTLSLILCALLIVSAVSCGEAAVSTSDTTAASGEAVQTDENAPEITENTEKPADTEKVNEAKSTYDCKLDCGITVTVGAKASEILDTVEKKLGKHTDFMEAPSCVHPGKDKVYTFDGFTLTSSPDAKGEEFISELAFTSDVVGFDSGIMIGSPADDVSAVFGDKFEEAFGVRKYTLDKITITITFDGDMVSALSVSSAF